MRKLTRKRILMPVVAALALAIAGVAYAYFTSSGTGSGTATVGTDAGVTIDPITFDETLYPGGSTRVQITINNTSTDTAAKVGTVVADDAGGNTNGISGLTGTCSAADFNFDDVVVDTEIAAGDSTSVTGTLSMDNTELNQDDCKNAAPVLHLKVDNSGI